MLSKSLLLVIPRKISKTILNIDCNIATTLGLKKLGRPTLYVTGKEYLWQMGMARSGMASMDGLAG